MCAFLRPIEKRFLPHSITVFNALSGSDYLLPIVIRNVNFNDSNSYHYRMAGVVVSASFRVVVDCANSDAEGREFVSVEKWSGLKSAEQAKGFYTLYGDMWLFKGIHPDLEGVTVGKKEMKPTVFEGKGLRLLKTKLLDITGLEKPHNMQLVG